jgi:hypothetical protein
MPSALARLAREIGFGVEEARAGYMASEVQLEPTPGRPELPPAVDELVAQGYQLPPTAGGSGTDAGWIT